MNTYKYIYIATYDRLQLVYCNINIIDQLLEKYESITDVVEEDTEIQRQTKYIRFDKNYKTQNAHTKQAIDDIIISSGLIDYYGVDFAGTCDTVDEFQVIWDALQ